MNDNYNWNANTGTSANGGAWSGYDENGQPVQWVQMPDGSWAPATKAGQSFQQPQQFNGQTYNPNAQPPSLNAGINQPTLYNQTDYNSKWGVSPYSQYNNTPQPYNQSQNIGPVIAGVAGIVLLLMVLTGGHIIFPFFLFFFLPWMFLGRRGRRRW